MKNRSIRFKITLWYAGALIVLIGVIVLIVYTAGGMVFRNTIRDYLVSVVEANTDNIAYVPEKETSGPSADIYVRCGDGFLQIDTDFMSEIHDVRSAVYAGNGELLYGENALARVTESVPFVETRLWNTSYKKMKYNIYDRKLNLDIPGSEGVWLRGIVSEEENVKKLDGIMKTVFMIIPFLILASVLIGYFIAGRMLKPVRRLEQAASSISKGSDLKKRIDPGDGSDEISDLANVFNDMFGRLENSFETEQRFTSDASHELRTPLSVILAQSEYMLEKDRSAEQYKEGFQVVYRQSRRMNELVNDMLDYTRMDQSPERYPLSRIDLSGTVAQTAEQMKELREKGISLSYEIEPGIEAEGNVMLLTRLTENLISNAYRYGAEDGSIRISLKKEDHYRDGRLLPVLSVKDDGIGIQKEEQEKIFERFYRSDASRSVKGTGLGLSMVKKAAELHGAAIEVESEPGSGSTFFVIFPEPESME